MSLSGEAQMLKIYIGESDKIGGKPLYEEIVLQAHKEGLSGATVYHGIMSYGASHSIHTMKVFALSGDLPLVVEIVDNQEKIQLFADVVSRMLDESGKGGLVLIQPASVVKYQTGKKYK